MIKNILFCLLTIFSLKVFAEGKKYSLEELDEAANLLKVVIDQAQDLSAANKAFCGFTGDEATQWIQPLHAWIDEGVATAADKYISDKKGHLDTRRKWRNCKETCHCGVYVDVMEKIGKDKLDKQDQKFFQSAKASAQKQSPQGSLTCAKKAAGLCKKPLFQQLKKEAASS